MLGYSQCTISLRGYNSLSSVENCDSMQLKDIEEGLANQRNEMTKGGNPENLTCKLSKFNDQENVSQWL